MLSTRPSLCTPRLPVHALQWAMGERVPLQTTPLMPWSPVPSFAPVAPRAGHLCGCSCSGGVWPQVPANADCVWQPRMPAMMPAPAPRLCGQNAADGVTARREELSSDGSH